MSNEHRFTKEAYLTLPQDRSASNRCEESCEGIESFEAVAGLEPDLWTFFITLDERESKAACGNLYRFVTHALLYCDYEQLVFLCPNGHPVWLTSFFRKLEGYGLRAEVTPEPQNPRLIQAIMAAVRTGSETSVRH